MANPPSGRSAARVRHGGTMLLGLDTDSTLAMVLLALGGLPLAYATYRYLDGQPYQNEGRIPSFFIGLLWGGAVALVF